MCDVSKIFNSGQSILPYAATDTGTSDIAKSLGVFGAVGAAVGAVVGGEAARSEALNQAAVSRLQGDIAEASVDIINMQADVERGSLGYVYAKGGLAESRIREAGRAVGAAQNVEFASRHLDRGYGSPLLIAAESAGRVQADVDLVHANTELEAAGVYDRVAALEGQALGAQGQVFTARLNEVSARGRASNARLASAIGAGATFLQGAARAFSPSGYVGAR